MYSLTVSGQVLAHTLVYILPTPLQSAGKTYLDVTGLSRATTSSPRNFAVVFLQAPHPTYLGISLSHPSRIDCAAARKDEIRNKLFRTSQIKTPTMSAHSPIG